MKPDLSADDLSTDQLSDRTGIPAETLRYWRRMKRGPRWYRLGPKLIRYQLTDVEEWLDNQRNGTAA